VNARCRTCDHELKIGPPYIVFFSCALGTALQGVAPQGAALQGVAPQGVALQGVALQGAALQLSAQF